MDMQPISFTANHLKNVSIKKQIASNKFEPITASIVELDIKDSRDLNAMYEAAKDWEQIKKGDFGLDIYYDATEISPMSTKELKNKRYYALTTQTSDFKNLDSKKIQGMALFFEHKNKFNELNALQVNPRANSEAVLGYRSYKNVGKSLVDYVKEVSKKPVMVYSTYSSKPFYEKQGFKQIFRNNKFYMFFK